MYFLYTSNSKLSISLLDKCYTCDLYPTTKAQFKHSHHSQRLKWKHCFVQSVQQIIGMINDGSCTMISDFHQSPETLSNIKANLYRGFS